MRRKLIAGNWKMNGLLADGIALAAAVAELAKPRKHKCDILICPPFTLLIEAVRAVAGTPIAVGGQDCHMKASGAHTGDVSAPMLADLGCRYVILGHSERRADHKEPDSLIKTKAQAALAASLIPIVCVGETEAERDSGRTLEVVAGQLKGSLPEGGTAERVVIAYEPVWAIGTGRTPTLAEVQEVHAMIRRESGLGQGVRILYGGSMKPSNAQELLALPDVDGGLIGGASLKADDFWAIATACP
ncbi:MAG: triose-phosphate isomerase [Alphaproteobacteria bacterium]|nr:triose-phosphate isomerase [Alphaproteobacteria bacterium]